ncbi:MAG: serine/threonine-protein kinase [Planctomycetota bacterium]|jgi:serine/threonine-protein kinase
MTTSRLSLFDLAPDKVLLDRYRIHSGHRENGMSAAFRVYDQKHKNVERELQAFPASLFENVKQAEAFAKTLRGWADLESDAVLALHDVVVLDDGAVLSISDFPSGQGLREIVAERKVLPEQEVVELGIALLDGLEQAHDSGLIHGDIKPATIFMGDDGAGPVLVDGGVTPGLWAAKHLGTRTALIGTPYYAPLEQFGGDSPDERSDMYNLATVMYELVSGVMPWRGKSYIEVFQSKMQPTAPTIRSMAPDLKVSHDFEAAIATALRGKRMERHESAAAFREALSDIKFD